jgi:hypothetical protein
MEGINVEGWAVKPVQVGTKTHYDIVGDTVVDLFQSGDKLPPATLPYGIDLKSTFKAINIESDSTVTLRMPIGAEQATFFKRVDDWAARATAQQGIKGTYQPLVKGVDDKKTVKVKILLNSKVPTQIAVGGAGGTVTRGTGGTFLNEVLNGGGGGAGVPVGSAWWSVSLVLSGPRHQRARASTCMLRS